MKPQSNDRSRAKALQAFLADGIDRSIDFMERDLSESRHHALSDIAPEDLPAGQVPGAGWRNLVIAAHLATREGWGLESVRKLSEACAYLWMNARFLHAKGVSKINGPNYVADSGSSRLIPTAWAAMLYAHSGHWDRAAWLAQYLHGYFQSSNLTSVSDKEDREYSDLLRYVLDSLSEGRWPSKIPDTLGPYSQWLMGRLDAESSQRQLEAVVDMRMARYFGYRYVDDSKSRRPSQDAFLMEGFAYAAIPTDLWAIQAMTRRFDGVELSLTGTHPWLAAPFMQPPPPIAMDFEDDLTRALRTAGDKQLGHGWAE